MASGRVSFLAVFDQDLLDLMDAVSIAVEDLRDRVENLPDDYTDEDRAEMTAKADRLNGLYPRLPRAYNRAVGYRG